MNHFVKVWDKNKTEAIVTFQFVKSLYINLKKSPDFPGNCF